MRPPGKLLRWRSPSGSIIVEGSIELAKFGNVRENR
jgi:hypothetical protein